MAAPRSYCPINLSLEIFGDAWTLLVLRDLMFGGKRHFREFLQSDEHISSNILADRLARLVEHGLLTRRDDPTHKQKAIYSLTEQGIELLPIVVQIPVFIALYWVLLLSVELRHAPFILWINDLSTPDPYFILPVLMGATMFIQTWLNPTPPDPMQAKLMKIMPIAFSIFFFFFASGLVLYWLVNNVLSIGQQWQITRALERSKAAHGGT